MATPGGHLGCHVEGATLLRDLYSSELGVV